MSNRISSNVSEVVLKVAFVTNGVLPEPALPHAALAATPAYRDVSFGYHGARKVPFQ
jgi:hypothetical protein